MLKHIWIKEILLIASVLITDPIQSKSFLDLRANENGREEPERINNRGLDVLETTKDPVADTRNVKILSDSQALQGLENVRYEKEEQVTERTKRYKLMWKEWNSRFLSYYLVNTDYDDLGPRSDVLNEVDRAFYEWGNYAAIVFQQASNASDADILIKFEDRYHNDGDPFDGPGGTLGHAYFGDPPYHGLAEIHLDKAEAFSYNWFLSYYLGYIHIFSLLLHEIGHIIGLSHSHSPNSIMNSILKPVTSLPDDDKREIFFLYGMKYIPGDENLANLQIYRKQILREFGYNPMDGVLPNHG